MNKAEIKKMFAAQVFTPHQSNLLKEEKDPYLKYLYSLLFPSIIIHPTCMSALVPQIGIYLAKKEFKIDVKTSEQMIYTAEKAMVNILSEERQELLLFFLVIERKYRNFYKRFTIYIDSLLKKIEETNLIKILKQVNKITPLVISILKNIKSIQ